MIRLYAGPEWSRAPVSSFARRWWDMICAGIDSDYCDSTSLQAMFFPVLLYGDFLWSCGCCNWWSLRSKIENLVQCRNESVSFEYTKRFAPNMYRSAQYLSQYSCVWNWSTKPDVHIFNSVVIWFWWFSQQGSAQSDPEPQFLGTTLPLSSSHESAHTSCGHAAKGLDGPDEHNHGDNCGVRMLSSFVNFTVWAGR